MSDYDPIPETCDDALRKWDAGESVFTVEMGGMGPGYEQAIQVLVFELIREYKDKPFPEANSEEAKSWGDEVARRLDKTYGYSGAQVGAAKNLASLVIKRGYRVALRDPGLGDDRLIQASKNFPQ